MTRRNRILVIVHALTAIVAAVALAVSVITAVRSLHDVRNAHIDGRLQACTLIQTIVLKSTPPAKLAKADKFLATYGLLDCQTYAHGH
jgi:HAMP domain-containing protein